MRVAFIFRGQCWLLVRAKRVLTMNREHSDLILLIYAYFVLVVSGLSALRPNYMGPRGYTNVVEDDEAGSSARIDPETATRLAAQAYRRKRCYLIRAWAPHFALAVSASVVFFTLTVTSWVTIVESDDLTYVPLVSLGIGGACGAFTAMRPMNPSGTGRRSLMTDAEGNSQNARIMSMVAVSWGAIWHLSSSDSGSSLATTTLPHLAMATLLFVLLVFIGAEFANRYARFVYSGFAVGFSSCYVYYGTRADDAMEALVDRYFRNHVVNEYWECYAISGAALCVSIIIQTYERCCCVVHEEPRAPVPLRRRASSRAH